MELRESNYMSSLVVMILMICVSLMICSSMVYSEEKINTENADKPFNFRDQKDCARLTTCVGPCLMEKHKNVMEFMNTLASKHRGLQVMFMGDKPELTVYNKDESVKQVYDISDKSPQEISDILEENGCVKVE